jgi:hypothetical protein
MAPTKKICPKYLMAGLQTQTLPTTTTGTSYAIVVAHQLEDGVCLVLWVHFSAIIADVFPE